MKDDMGRTCSTHGNDDKCIHIGVHTKFVGEDLILLFLFSHYLSHHTKLLYNINFARNIFYITYIFN